MLYEYENRQTKANKSNHQQLQLKHAFKQEYNRPIKSSSQEKPFEFMQLTRKLSTTAEKTLPLYQP